MIGGVYYSYLFRGRFLEAPVVSWYVVAFSAERKRKERKANFKDSLYTHTSLCPLKYLHIRSFDFNFFEVLKGLERF